MIKKVLFFGVLVLVSANLLATNNYYWQQKVNYEMKIDFDSKNHQFSGNQKLTYFNNSPDTLFKVFYHLYFNAFQPNSMMDVRSRSIEDPDQRVGDRIFKLQPNEIGYQKVNKLSQNGIKLKSNAKETILEVFLDKPILPGQSTVFEMEFEAQVPVQIRRSGRYNSEGVAYSMTQWYPKLCEYDREGWHNNPYIGREFHGVWGDFDVKINMDSAFMIGGTGYLQNADMIGKGYSTKNVAPKTAKVEWHFKAPNVHDFAWAADTKYIHKTATLNNGTVLHFIHKNDSTYNANWDSLMPKTVKAFEFINRNFGEYPYKQFSVVQGGDGGMEYAMSTLITAKGSFAGLVSVTVHEALHSWYQGVLASDEGRYPWMDEGFTSFAQELTLRYVNGGKGNLFTSEYRSYNRLVNDGKEEPLTTHADFYHLNRAYSTASYAKGSIFLNQLSYVVGFDVLMSGLKQYFEEWKFKHPTPTDFKKVMERVSGIELDWYFDAFIGTTYTVDYAIGDIVADGNKTNVVLVRKGRFPMPMDVVVTLKNGKQLYYYIPLNIMYGHKTELNTEKVEVCKEWPWVHERYMLQIDKDIDKIETIEIDPSLRMADINRVDNIYPNRQDLIFKGK